MIIIDLIETIVATLPGAPVFVYGSDRHIINNEADGIAESFVFLQIPPFTISASKIGAISKTYRCVFLVMGKAAGNEKESFNKNIWGDMEARATLLYNKIAQNEKVVTIAPADNSVNVNQFDAAFDGVTMAVNITMRDTTPVC